MAEEIFTQEPVWTKSDLQALLNGMQKNIQKCDERTPYSRAKKTFDWKRVAFRSFSAEICRRKWEDIERNIQKTRSLSELIKEAEGAIEAPSSRKDFLIHPDFPKKPNPPNSIFFQKEHANFAKLHPNLRKTGLMKLVNQEYNKLPAHQKAKYTKLFQLATEEYEHKKKQFRNQYPMGQNVRGPSHQKFKHQKHQNSKRPVANDEGPPVKRKKHFECEPKKPPITSFAVFCSEEMELLKDKVPNAKYRLMKVSPLWQNLPVTEKECYQKMARDNIQEYSVKLQEWLRTLSEEDRAMYKEHNADKLKFLKKHKEMTVVLKEDARKDRPSDSEDEDIEDTTSEEDDCSEPDGEEEDDEDDNMEEEEEDDDNEMTMR